MDDDSRQTSVEGEDHILDTVEGEIYFFRALMRARPVGIHRYFHVISMQRAIEIGTGREVPVEDIWQKLETCFNLDALEALEGEYDDTRSASSTPQPTPSPKPGDDLLRHPFFRSEFSLPNDNYIDDLIARRRLRATASLPSSPAPFVPKSKPASRGRKRKASTADLAGLVSGDSDSSALTQDSGDDNEDKAQAQSPSEKRAASVATATEAGTEDLQDEEDTASPDPSSSVKVRRGGRRSMGGGRGRGASSIARGTRRRKKQ